MWEGDMTRSVWRKRFKVIGLVLSIMMLGAWVFSVMYASNYTPPGTQWTISIGFGRIVFGDDHLNSGWTCAPIYPYWKHYAEKLPWTEFSRHWLGFGLPSKSFDGTLQAPAWLFVVAVGFPTSLLWWRDRPKAGFCRICKYDLTGNVSGICPECGTAVE